LFNCVQYGNHSFLATDLSITCDDAAYHRWKSAAVMFILLYVIGIPSAGFASVFYYRHHLNDPTVKQRFRFLYGGYAMHAYFWEFVIIIRKVILVAIVVFLKTQNFRSVYAALWLLIASLLSHVWLSPFESSNMAVLETISLCVLLATLMFGLLAYAPNFSDPEKTLSAVAVIGLNLILTLLLVAVLIYLYYNMLFKNARLYAMYEAVKKKILSSRRRRGPDEEILPGVDGEEEMHEIESKYHSPHTSMNVTADALRFGRTQFNMKLDSETHVDNNNNSYSTLEPEPRPRRPERVSRVVRDDAREEYDAAQEFRRASSERQLKQKTEENEALKKELEALRALMRHSGSSTSVQPSSQ